MSETQPSLNPLLDEAAGWFARLNTNTISHADLAAFRTWRAVPEHADAYAQIEHIWGKAAGLSDDADIQAAVAAVKPRRSAGSRITDLWRALARRPMLGIGLAVAAGALAMLSPRLVDGDLYATRIGEQRTVRLADGSRIQLDTDSRVKVRLSGGRRDIDLVRGQALFDVAHDPSRPFTVRAGQTEVRALGTRFDVRRFSDSVKVTLLEGRVEVRRRRDHSVKPWSLEPGQQVLSGLAPSSPRRVDVAAATSWTQGQLVFRDTPLSAAIAEVNRYSTRPITLDSDRLSDEPINGVFQTDDTDAFLKAVVDLHGLERAEGANGAIVLQERSPG